MKKLSLNDFKTESLSAQELDKLSGGTETHACGHTDSDHERIACRNDYGILNWLLQE